MLSTRNTDSSGGHKPLRRRLSDEGSDIRRKHTHLKLWKFGNCGENRFGLIINNVETVIGIFLCHLESTNIVTSTTGARDPQFVAGLENKSKEFLEGSRDLERLVVVGHGWLWL